MRVTVYLPPYFVGLKLQVNWLVIGTPSEFEGIHIALHGCICCSRVRITLPKPYVGNIVLHLVRQAGVD